MLPGADTITVMPSWIVALVLAGLVGTNIPDAGPTVWPGFAATSESESTLAAYAHGPLEVFATPNDPKGPTRTQEANTILGTVTVLAVLSPPEAGWVEVMLPGRPNGSTGWVRANQVSLFIVDGHITVDLSDKVLTYVIDDVEVLRTQVGIGSPHNETPVGEFFVTDNVRLADPTGPWGSHALGLSGRSDTITEFNGGDGIIGIHGTNNPASIGDDISLGCVRLPNDMIALLYELVPIGTRVTVQE